LNWNWDASRWKKSTKVLVGAATIWPLVYMFLFLGSIFSMVMLLPFAENRSTAICGRLNVLQLDRKIQAGEIRELKIRFDDIIATDRAGSCTYETRVTDETTRRAIVNEAKELVDGRPRVEVIDENTSQSDAPLFVPIGFGVLMIAHLATMLLIMGLMPLYIVLAVKNERLDQTMRIVWVVLACTVGMFANIVYWYQHIWRRPAGSGTGATPPTQSPATM
jgi:hypothetical protein